MLPSTYKSRVLAEIGLSHWLPVTSLEQEREGGQQSQPEQSKSFPKPRRSPRLEQQCASPQSQSQKSPRCQQSKLPSPQDPQPPQDALQSQRSPRSRPTRRHQSEALPPTPSKHKQTAKATRQKALSRNSGQQQQAKPKRPAKKQDETAAALEANKDAGMEAEEADVQADDIDTEANKDIAACARVPLEVVFEEVESEIYRWASTDIDCVPSGISLPSCPSRAVDAVDVADVADVPVPGPADAFSSPITPEASVIHGSAHPTDNEDCQPDTSTVVYSQVSFKEFRLRVLSFAKEYFNAVLGYEQYCIPSEKAPSYQIRRISGGSYNRIVGLNIDNRGDVRKFVIRIPRTKNADVSSEVAILKFLEKNTQVPVPSVVDYDPDDNYILESPFAVQRLVSGASLYNTFPTLQFNDKKRLARDLGLCIQKIMQVRSGTAGRLDFGNPYDRFDNPGWKLRTVSGSPSSKGSTEVGVKPFIYLGRPRTRTASNGNVNSSSLAMDEQDIEQQPDPVHMVMISMFQERKREYSNHAGNEMYRMMQVDKFCGIVSGLRRFGFLTPKDGDIHYTLAHLDFAARNIFVDFSLQEPKSAITAVLDWDSAIMAPRFVACNPPAWLWQDWNEAKDKGRKFTDETEAFSPKTTEGQTLKQIFDETVGAAYCELAYDEVYRLARRMFRFAKDGIQTCEDFEDADYIVDRWRTLYAELRQAKP